MAVYVDDAHRHYGRMIMCHMIADTPAELRDMARKIGVGNRWVQFPNTPKEHYDVCLTMRALAVKSGAIEITSHELGAKIRERE